MAGVGTWVAAVKAAAARVVAKEAHWGGYWVATRVAAVQVAAVWAWEKQRPEQLMAGAGTWVAAVQAAAARVLAKEARREGCWAATRAAAGKAAAARVVAKEARWEGCWAATRAAAAKAAAARVVAKEAHRVCCWAATRVAAVQAPAASENQCPEQLLARAGT